MRITIEPTSKIVQLQTIGAESIPARIWEGVTDRGTPVHCYVTRICPSIDIANLPQSVIDEFEANLEETRAPSEYVAPIPMRLIL